MTHDDDEKRRAGGGPAFPHEYKFGDGTANRHDGMTLRDYFAARAMQGFLASWGQHDVQEFAEITSDAYRIADSMLKEREA